MLLSFPHCSFISPLSLSAFSIMPLQHPGFTCTRHFRPPKYPHLPRIPLALWSLHMAAAIINPSGCVPSKGQAAGGCQTQHYLGFGQLQAPQDALWDLVRPDLRPHTPALLLLSWGLLSVLLDENSDLAVTQLSLWLFFIYLPSLTVIQTQELLEWCAMSKTPRLKTAPEITHLHKKYLARDK